MVSALLAGCASGGAASSTATKAAPGATGSVPVASPSASSSGDLLEGRVLPLFAYEQTGEWSAAVDRATAVLKNECLARYGFAPLPVADTPLTPPMYRVYGVTDPAIAARYGYHLDPVGQSIDATAAPPPPVLSSDEQLVLLGSAGGAPTDPRSVASLPTPTYGGKPVPPLGCQGEAAKAVDVVGVSDDELGLAQQLGAEAFVRSKTDSRMVEATARWSACMAEHGYGGHYSDPSGASGRFSIERPISRKEIATAVADVECKRRTKLIDTWFAVESEYEEAAIQKNLETLTKAKAARDDALRRALAVTHG